MNIPRDVFQDSYKIRTVANPITFTPDNCKLLTTKKESYYNHTYEPKPFLDILRSQLNISTDILSRFEDRRRENCCNVISITLYNKDCTFAEFLLKYLKSINRTVKNVDKKLKDWIVRLYLDKSVYECINNISESLKTSTLDDGELRSRRNCLDLFNNIIRSPNVEVYTFICNDEVNLDKTRTYRYLVLIDPEVNISAIREADGYINNLECHNLKMFQKARDKLFYTPPAINRANLIEGEQFTIFHSYSSWLQFHKNILNRKYFSTNQNIYDLLAGLFTCKLKIKPQFYYDTARSLHTQIDAFNTPSMNDDIRSTYIGKADIPLRNELVIINLFDSILKSYDEFIRYLERDTESFQEIIKILNIGFDEILLLEIFKEVISFSFSYNFKEYEHSITPYTTKIEQLKNLFFAYNIKNYKLNDSTLGQLIAELKRDGIIESSFTLDGHLDLKMSSYSHAFIDSIILKNIIGNVPFNITNGVDKYSQPSSLLSELNNYYNPEYDRSYDEDYIPAPIVRVELALPKLMLGPAFAARFVNPPSLGLPPLALPSTLGRQPLAHTFAQQKYLKYKNKYAMLKKKLLQYSA